MGHIPLACLLAAALLLAYGCAAVQPAPKALPAQQNSPLDAIGGEMPPPPPDNSTIGLARGNDIPPPPPSG